MSEWPLRGQRGLEEAAGSGHTPALMRRRAWTAGLLALAACLPAGEASCQAWADTFCTRLWLCTVEHSRSDPAFVARYGDSPQACRALQARACLQVAPCVPAAEAEACRLATERVSCSAPLPLCAPACDRGS